MEYQRFGNYILMRADVDEEVIEAIKAVIKRENVEFARISGIGLVNKVTLAFYHLENCEYRYNYFPGSYEITSLQGNIMNFADGDIHVHTHATIADRGHRVYGGHLKSAYVGAAFEAVIDIIPGEGVHRIISERSKLPAVAFSNGIKVDCKVVRHEEQ